MGLESLVTDLGWNPGLPRLLLCPRVAPSLPEFSDNPHRELQHCMESSASQLSNLDHACWKHDIEPNRTGLSLLKTGIPLFSCSCILPLAPKPCWLPLPGFYLPPVGLSTT